MAGVYGEEFKQVQFSYGMWDSNIAPVMDGFVKSCVNMVPTENGYLQVRGDIQRSTTLFPDSASFNNRYGSLSFPTQKHKLYPFTSPAWVSLGGTQSSTLAFIDSSGGTFTYIPTSDSSTSGAYDPVGGASAFVLYRDRLYDNANRYTGWNFTTAAAVTTVALASPPAALVGTNVQENMFFFKDRLFRIDATRVAFTDVIAAGGYPETWNAGSNFFDLPTSNDTTIQGYAIINNVIYFFTGEGIFSLQVAGPPANWLLKRIDEKTSVPQNGVGVAKNGGVVYISAVDGIYIFNGYATQKISTPIQEIIDKYDVAGIFAFGEGIVLSLVNYTFVQTASLPPRGFWQVNASKNFYFNGLGWSELTMGNPEVTFFLCKSVVNKTFSNVPRPVTLFSYVEWSGTTCTTKTAYYESNTHGTEDKYISIVNDYVEGQPHKEKRFKYGYADLQSQIGTLFTSNAVDGASYTAEDSTTLGTVADDVYYLKIPMPQFARRLRTKIRADVLIGSYVGNPLQVRGLGFVQNVSRNRPDQADG